MLLSAHQQQTEQSSVQKLFSLLQGLNKSIAKSGSLNNLQSVSSNLDAAANEIGFLLQARDLNEFSHLVNKLSCVWKELYKAASYTKSTLEYDDQPDGHQQKLELIQQTKKQMKEGQGEIGQLGGVRVSQYQTPQSKHTARQISRQLTGLPSLSGHPQTTETKTRSNYEIDDSQREILQEVLKQSNKLNVQIVMKRYDPKITLMISEGTDTNLDIQEAIRGFNKDYLEIKLQEITTENRKNINEIQKAISEKHDYSQIAESVAADKLKSIYKSIYSKTTEMDQFVLEASKQEPQIFKDIIDDFITHVSDNYKDVQSETFKIVAKIFKEIQQKQKQEELLKSRTLQVQQPQHKKDKLSSSKRANQSSADESQVSEKIRQELIEKKLEVDKKNQEIHELQNKIRSVENQYIQTALELESMKMNVSRSEQEKAQINYEFKKLEKQLTSVVSKTFQDQAIQCTDIGQQNLISKLQKENQQYEQKIYKLKSEINKISPRSGIEYKQQNTELQDDQNYQNSYNGTPKLTSKYRSAYDLDNQLLEDGMSIDQRLDSSQQMYKNSEISNREKLDELGFERSPTHSNTMKVNTKTRKSNMQLETRQTNSPLSNSERSVRIQTQLAQNNFNQKKKKKGKILKIDEEDSTLNQSNELQKQKMHRQSFANKVTRRQTTLEVSNRELYKQQSSIKDQDETQAATNVDTHRTSSGQAFIMKRAKSGEKKNESNGRRIQTEAIEFYQDSEEDSQSDTRGKIVKSQTFRDQKKVKSHKKISQHRPSQQKFQAESQIETVEEIPSNVTSMQSLDKGQKIIKKPTIDTLNDEELKSKKDQLKYVASSPIRRSSTSGPQQLQMIIKLNDEHQQQFTTYWHPRHLDQETQTDSNLLIQLLYSTITQLDLPLNMKQQIVLNLPNKIETAIGMAMNQSQIIHQTGNLSSEQQWQQQESKTHLSSRQSLESIRNRQSTLAKSVDQQGQQKLKQLYDLNQFEPPLTRTSLDQQSSRQYTQKNSVELADGGKSEKSEVLMKSKEDLIQKALKQQEALLRLDDYHNLQDDELGFEELAREIIANENGGQQLEQFKPNDIQSDNFVKKVYSNMANRQTKGAAAVQDLLRRYYKKNVKDPISYLEFKGFYQKIHATHKQCGFNIVCAHLQRFLMRLGFTCSLFSKRKIYKTSLSILKPFNPLQDSKAKLVNTSATNQSSNRFQTNQYFSSEQ